MQLISSIKIKGFRSIKNSENTLSSMGNFNAFAGFNNSGKSNLLRALNAFFTGYTDPQIRLNFTTDYYRHDLHKRRKSKIIEIAVEFGLPDNFKFQKKLQSVKDILGRNFTITKQWKKQSSIPDYFLNNRDNKIGLEERLKIDQFLSLINYRYIPNRVQPIDIIKSEHQALRDVLVRRLGKEAKSAGDTFDKIQSVSSNLIRNLSARLSKISTDSGNVRLATPKNWADMIFAFGYRLGNGKIELEDSVQGSGIQSLLMLETLFLIDKDYFQQFGWRQASIWAIEEPESSMHSSMEAQVAEFLNSISNTDSSRLQIFSTTHSDLILQYADKSFYTKQDSKETKFDGKLSTKDILLESAKDGVSRFVHPILFHPLEPVVLVDGKYDCPFLSQAVKLLAPKSNIIVTCLEEFEERKSGGEDDIYMYLKNNKNIIANRNRYAPIVVLLDWDSKPKRSNEFQKLSRGLNNKLIVKKWPEENTNPKLDKSFRGIERFYSDRIINIAGKRCSNKIATKGDGVKTIEKSDYEEIKRVCYEEIKNKGIQSKDIKFVQNFLNDLIKAINIK